jgi:hexosaminidase
VSHQGVGKPVRLEHPPSPRYPGNGPDTLTDGLRAPDNPAFNHDRQVWLGFEGENMVVVIDLGSRREIRSVELGCLQQVDSWIFAPTEVTVSVSLDGISYSSLQAIPSKLSLNYPDPLRATYVARWEKRAQARYIRVLARTVGRCPDWHPGAGRKAWLFADEITIR